MMPQNPLGQTGINVSLIGLGTVKFGRNQQVKYPEPFAIPDDQALQNLLAKAYELGINLLDTAPAYGHSEERLGKLLKNQRQQWILCTKVGEEFNDGQSSYAFSKTAILKSIHRSLKRLQTDYLDIVLVHSNGDDEKIIREDDVFTTLRELQQQGLIRAIGMSTKTVAGGLLTLEQTDVAMVTYNPLERDQEAVLEYAAKHHKGILIKKALASGHINKFASANPVSTAMQCIFQHSCVSSVILGTVNVNHLIENVRCAEEAWGAVNADS